jgi:A/G-specific adenine glycosylase
VNALETQRRTVESLLEWFDSRNRDVPSRGSTDPYAILVAEVMAQQTRIATVRPYFIRFLELFPTVEALADAEIDQVLKAWEGLGYYARAEHLHRAAGLIVSRHQGCVPSDVDALRALPGIGPYTAGALASIAFGQTEPAIDGNARRVLTRLFDLEKPKVQDLESAARELLSIFPHRPGALNQALMDLGSTTCLPRHPNCEQCPLNDPCLARARNTVADRPAPKSLPPKPHRHAAAAVIRKDELLFLWKRPTGGLLGGLWDFPHVAIEKPSEAVAALEATIKSEWGLSISVGKKLQSVRHVFSHFRLQLELHEAQWEGGAPQHEDLWQWARIEDLPHLAFPVTQHPLIAGLVGTRRS